MMKFLRAKRDILEHWRRWNFKIFFNQFEFFSAMVRFLRGHSVALEVVELSERLHAFQMYNFDMIFDLC